MLHPHGTCVLRYCICVCTCAGLIAGAVRAGWLGAAGGHPSGNTTVLPADTGAADAAGATLGVATVLPPLVSGTVTVLSVLRPLRWPYFLMEPANAGTIVHAAGGSGNNAPGLEVPTGICNAQNRIINIQHSSALLHGLCSAWCQPCCQSSCTPLRSSLTRGSALCAARQPE